MARPYIIYGGVIRRRREVRCKGACETVVAKYDVMGRKLIPTEAYTELVIVLKLPNGVYGQHETAMCRSCFTRIIMDGPRPGELGAIYAQDIETWISEARKAGVSLVKAVAMAEKFSSRVPVTALTAPGRGAAGL